jgi:hypothetical protein
MLSRCRTVNRGVSFRRLGDTWHFPLVSGKNKNSTPARASRFQ